MPWQGLLVMLVFHRPSSCGNITVPSLPVQVIYIHATTSNLESISPGCKGGVDLENTIIEETRPDSYLGFAGGVWFEL